MSNLPESEFDLDLQLLPSWAKQAPDANRFARFTGEEETLDRSREGRYGRRPPRRDGDRPSRDRRPERGDRRDGGGGRPRGDRDRDRRHEHAAPPREIIPLPPYNVVLMPDEKGVESITRQIKTTGRAYPLFDIAQIILQKPERQQVKFEVTRKPDGAVVQPLYVCALDESPWASEEEAVAHVLSAHFDTFYQTDKQPADPPKGTYTFVAQCGMSGVILGPPNHHDYQNQLRRLHGERFSRMPFETFKSRVKIVKEEAVVKKWVEDQSWKTEYVALNLPEPKRLLSREEVERHFREVHLPNVIKQLENVKLAGPASREIKSHGLQRLLRHAWDEQKRFPLKLVTVLSQQFATRGLHFFKVNKTITHVSVARPHYLDLENTAVSEGVQKIVQFISARPRCTRRTLIEGLTTPMPAPVAQAPAPAAAQPAAPAGELQPTPEQSALVADLHWLIHQGHVIEFANGIMELARKPAPKPPKPAPAPKEGAPAAAVEPVAVEAAHESEHGSEAAVETAPAAEASVPASTATTEAAATASAESPAAPEPTAGAKAPATGGV
jgi:hypothetical protein